MTKIRTIKQAIKYLDKIGIDVNYLGENYEISDNTFRAILGNKELINYANVRKFAMGVKEDYEK